MCNLTPQSIKIQLTHGVETVIDLDDSDLASFKWHSLIRKTYSHGVTYWACRSITINKKYKHLLLHRVILSRMLGRDLTGKEFVDHINGNPLDNRRSNLRLADKSQNTINGNLRSDNLSGYKGVCWSKYHNKWAANICKNGKQKHIGYFNTPEDAYVAYCEAAKELHGEFVRI